MRYKVSVCTLGCRVNQYESRAIEECFESLGFKIADFGVRCDVYVINTCAVTSESERKSRQMIRRARKLNPSAVVAVVGCSSQLAPERAAQSGADIILGTADKLRVCREAARMLTIPRLERAMLCDTAFTNPDPACDAYTLKNPVRSRAFVKIEDGCDGNCAYCIIAKARGEVRCKPPESVYDEVNAIARSGCREVTLVGIELSAYKPDLAGLITRINTIDGIERIRLGSLDPAMLTHDFCDRLASFSKVQPHFHISLQSGCSAILAAMRRRYTAETARERIGYLRSLVPQLTLSCDLIVGFPGESEEDFEQTLEFLSFARFLHAHVFPFSPRPGTPAAKMDNQLTAQCKSERQRRVNELQRTIKTELLDQALDAKTALVLFESCAGGVLMGHTGNFLEVRARGSLDRIGALAAVRVLSHDSEALYAEII